MKHATRRKLKSVRGSSIAEALVGFLISVLSVLTLLSIATTTLELIKRGDASIQVLYAEEGKMDAFVNGGVSAASTEGATLYNTYTPSGGGSPVKYHLKATGQIDGTTWETTGEVAYYITQRHHLFGLVPNAS